MKIPPNYNYEKLYFRRFIINRIRNSISINCRLFRRKPKLKMKTTEEKNLLLAELKAHEIADEFVRGTWLDPDGVRGCFYGCTMKTRNNAREKFSEKYDIDLWYCYLTEKIFENLPAREFRSFPHDSIEIITLNFDFNKVKSEWNKAMLLKQLDWVTDEKVREVLVNTAKLFDVPFNEIDMSAAWSAASSAAWSAESAESARSAARSVESVRSAELARQNHYVWMRDTLFSIIKKHS